MCHLRETATVAIILMTVMACRPIGVPEVFEVSWERGAVLRVADARHLRRIDLRDDVEGCLGELYDPTTPEDEQLGSGENEGAILDVTESEGDHFVLVTAVTAPNCNIQGMCGGGGPNVTLIWLHLGRGLSVIAKRAFAVVDCLASRGVEGAPDWGAGGSDRWLADLGLESGVLSIRFEEHGQHGDISGRVIYDRRRPKDGLDILRAPATDPGGRASRGPTATM